MISGRVDALRQARVALEIVDNDGQFHSIEAVIDTGFTGYLTLTPELISRIGLQRRPSIEISLAARVSRRLRSYRGEVIWHERPRVVRILEAPGTPLLGMRLLSDSQLTIQVRPGGNVLIEEM